MLHIGAAESVAIVRVNDRDVGIGKDSHLASEFEIGDVLVPGTNTLEVRVVKWSDASFIEDQDEWWLGGITRSVFLYSTGRTYLADVKAIAGLADDLTTGTLELGVQVAFDQGVPEHGWMIEAELGVPGIPLDVPCGSATSSTRSATAGNPPRTVASGSSVPRPASTPP